MKRSVYIQPQRSISPGLVMALGVIVVVGSMAIYNISLPDIDPTSVERCRAQVESGLLAESIPQCKGLDVFVTAGRMGEGIIDQAVPVPQARPDALPEVPESVNTRVAENTPRSTPSSSTFVWIYSGGSSGTAMPISQSAGAPVISKAAASNPVARSLAITRSIPMPGTFRPSLPLPSTVTAPATTRAPTATGGFGSTARSSVSVSSGGS